MRRSTILLTAGSLGLLVLALGFSDTRLSGAADGSAAPLHQEAYETRRLHTISAWPWDISPDGRHLTIIDWGTGDLAVMDENGYCKITGRMKNMIIRGGENIYPREIEEFLYTHPKISDVQVYGVPDKKYGEQVMAAVKIKEGVDATEEEIRAFCRGRIANYKVPYYVRFVDEYPMTASGKIQKFKLREMAIAEMGLAEQGRTETA